MLFGKQNWSFFSLTQYKILEVKINISLCFWLMKMKNLLFTKKHIILGEKVKSSHFHYGFDILVIITPCFFFDSFFFLFSQTNKTSFLLLSLFFFLGTKKKKRRFFFWNAWSFFFWMKLVFFSFWSEVGFCCLAKEKKKV